MGAGFLPFTRPSISEDEIEAAAEVLRSGWITTGPKCAEFEDRFRDYVGGSSAIALASGTAGMHLVLRALGIGPGDEVVTPSMTWVSTVNLIVLAGATPVFVDVDRDTLMTTAERIEEKIGERTRLIVPVHFAGSALDLDPIRRLAADRGVRVVEDAAHSVGTRYRGEHVGGRGTAVFSFHAIKNLTTAEGGMLCSDDAELADRIRRMKFHGLGVDAYDRKSQGRSPQAEVLEPGFKYNLTDISAAIGLVQLARVDEFNRKRAELAARYAERLADVDEIRPLAVPGYPATHAWHLYVVRLDLEKTGLDRAEFMTGLERRGVGTGIHFQAVHLQRYYRENLRTEPLPDTEWNSRRICSLPLFPGMTPDDVDRVVEAIRDVLGGSGR